MRIHYPYPLMFEADPTELSKYDHAIGMLAITPKKTLEIVQEIHHPSIWKSFWTQVKAKDPSLITLNKEENEDLDNISWVGESITRGLDYIVENGYVFIGLIYFSKGVFDSRITEERSWFRRKGDCFDNMLDKYHEIGIFPELDKRKDSIYSQFIGTGEKFFRHSDTLEKMDMFQIAKMSAYFRGKLTGICGMNTEPNETFQFVILSQNITKEIVIPKLTFDKKGRNTLENLVKLKKFIPLAGFKIEYGIWALKNLSQWGSIEILPQFTNSITKYNKYLSALTEGKNSPYPINNFVSPFEYERSLMESNKIIPKEQETVKIEKSPLIIKVHGKVIEDQPEQIVESDYLKKVELPAIDVKKLIKDDLEKIPELPKVHIPEKKIITPSLEKVEIPSLQKDGLVNESKIGEYDDVFNDETNINEIFDENSQVIVDQDKMDSVLKAGAYLIEEDIADFGNINPILMSQEDIFKDLEASLAAMSELDELSDNDEAVSRIFYPPPTLISFANKEGMQIGGSVCMISMGVGRNIWMVPELRRMQMWASFWSQEEIEGNPQIKDFVAMDEKDVESPEELENILQKAFIRIKRNNQIFLGVSELEGNGFERNVFDECELDSEIIQKLMDIHINKRTTTDFPKLASDSWIEIRYFGNPNAISFLTNPKSPGALEIAADIARDIRYHKGIITGIMCVDLEAAYFFILTDNLSEVEEENPSFEIDDKTLDKMFTMIENGNLTPVSWCKFTFGINGLERIPLWEDIQDGAIFSMIRENYENYMGHLLKIKSQEDSVRIKVESEFPAFETDGEMVTSEDAVKCTFCGTENPLDSVFCVACGKKFDE